MGRKIPGVGEVEGDGDTADSGGRAQPESTSKEKVAAEGGLGSGGGGGVVNQLPTPIPFWNLWKLPRPESPV